MFLYIYRLIRADVQPEIFEPKAQSCVPSHGGGVGDHRRRWLFKRWPLLNFVPSGPAGIFMFTVLGKGTSRCISCSGFGD